MAARKTFAELENLNEALCTMDEIPEQYRVSDFVQKEYLINGELRTWEGPMQTVRGAVWVRNKETGELEQPVIGQYPILTAKEGLEALDAAAAAFNNGNGAWPRMNAEERIAHMKEFVQKMRAQKELMVKLIMWEIGKSLKDATKEFDRTVAYINDTIDSLKDLDRTSSRFEITQGVIAQVRRAPLGVVLCMGPYNYPLNETFTLLIPALLMGNTVVIKPPHMGILLHQPLLRAFAQCFPRGVVNAVYGRGAVVVAPMLATGKISVLSFIGSSTAADTLKKQHPHPHRLRGVLGLEAKNTAIVLPDTDLKLAVSECVVGSLSFNGQRCTALKMIYVHRKIATKFIDAFVARIAAMVPGLPWENPDITPLPSVREVDRIDDIVKDALEKGARLLDPRGGRKAGALFQPAILTDITPDMRIYKEEQFGPIVPIKVFDDISEPLDFIETSNYGQQASIFGTDPAQVSSLVDRLVHQVCRVNINSQCQRGPDVFPFTGRKDSAENTLSVSDALRCFSIRTMVAANYNDTNNDLLTSIVHGRKSKFLTTDFIF